MKKIGFALIAASMLVTGSALADETTTTAAATTTTEPTPATTPAAKKEGGFEIGVRLGYGLPMGDLAKDAKLSDSVSGMLPIWLDIGYRINPNIFVGGYAQYGIAFVKDCPDSASCSASSIRFGAQAHYHIIPDQTFDPWVGLGALALVTRSSRRRPRRAATPESSRAAASSS
jgi:hypothetical protein